MPDQQQRVTGQLVDAAFRHFQGTLSRALSSVIVSND
jgi:hypothetical protein